MENDEIRFRRVDTSWGEFLLAASGKGLVAVFWPSRRRVSIDESWNPALRKAAMELRAYVDGRLRAFSVPLDLFGTPFQVKVWKELGKIRWGKTSSYGEVARKVGRRGAARAVGNAAGRNPLPIFIPCHRLLASGGRLGGFSGGLRWKRKLLSHEGIHP